MPNYSLQINSRFRPFSFQEMVAPWQLYGQAYKEQEDMLADLDTKANIWENMLNKEQDPELYQQYSDYANTLKAQAESLASQGLTPTSRQTILGLRSRYAKDITPIENAFNTRKEQAKMQLQAQMQNPSLMFSRDAASTKLLDYVKNPELDYSTINGNDVTQKVFAQAQALSKELIDNKEDLRKVLGGDYYEYVKQRGFTKEAVLAAIMDRPNASPVLQQLVNDAVESSGVNSWNNQDMTNRVASYAKQGLWGAVGTSEAQLVNNWRAQSNLQYDHAKELEDKRHEHAKDENKGRYSFPFKSSDGKTYWYNPSIGMYTDEDGNIVEKPKDAPAKVGTTPNSSNNNSKPNKYDLSGISTMVGAYNAGYQLMGVGIKANKGNGPWEVYRDGEDITGGNVKSYFQNRSWRGFKLFNRSDADFTPSNTSDLMLNFGEGENEFMTAVRSALQQGYTIDDFDDMDEDFKKGLKSVENYLKSQGIPDGLLDERIKVAVVNTPEEGKYDFLVFRK